MTAVLELDGLSVDLGGRQVLTSLTGALSGRAVGLLVGLYWLRMFAITAGYHRYFSHRAYKTSRVFQFVLGFLGCRIS